MSNIDENKYHALDWIYGKFGKIKGVTYKNLPFLDLRINLNNEWTCILDLCKRKRLKYILT